MARCSTATTGLAGIQAAAGGRDVNAAWVIDTVVPREFLKTSTQASNCLANTSIIVVPRPEFVLSNWPPELGRMGGKKRAEGMTPEQRAEIANKAAKLR